RGCDSVRASRRDSLRDDAERVLILDRRSGARSASLVATDGAGDDAMRVFSTGDNGFCAVGLKRPRGAAQKIEGFVRGSNSGASCRDYLTARTSFNREETEAVETRLHHLAEIVVEKPAIEQRSYMRQCRIRLLTLPLLCEQVA